MKRLLQKCCFGIPNKETQIEVDHELHTLIPSKLTMDWAIPIIIITTIIIIIIVIII